MMKRIVIMPAVHSFFAFIPFYATFFLLFSFQGIMAAINSFGSSGPTEDQ
jgi:hypothetical protein